MQAYICLLIVLLLLNHIKYHVCIGDCTHMVSPEEGIRYPAFSLAFLFPGDSLLIESRVMQETSKQRGLQSLLPEQ